MDENLVRLIGEVERVAPLVWAGAIRQATLNAVVSLILGIILTSATIWSWRWCILGLREYEDMDEEEKVLSRLLLGITSAAFIALWLTLVWDFIRWLISPRLMAIRLILGN